MVCFSIVNQGGKAMSLTVYLNPTDNGDPDKYKNDSFTEGTLELFNFYGSDFEEKSYPSANEEFDESAEIDFDARP